MQAYIQSTPDINWEFYIWPISKLISLSSASSGYTVKVFTTYYLYFKKKPRIIKFTYNLFLFQLSL